MSSASKPVALVGWECDPPEALRFVARVLRPLDVYTPALEGAEVVVLGDDALDGLRPRRASQLLPAGGRAVWLSPCAVDYARVVTWSDAGFTRIVSRDDLVRAALERVDTPSADAAPPRSWLPSGVRFHLLSQEGWRALEAVLSLRAFRVQEWCERQRVTRRALGRLLEPALRMSPKAILRCYQRFRCDQLEADGFRRAAIAPRVGFVRRSSLNRGLKPRR